MEICKVMTGLLVAIVGTAGLALDGSGTAAGDISDVEASALIGAAELPRHFVDEDGGCNGICNQSTSTACIKSASYRSGTAGERGTKANDIQCTNCGGNCSVIWQDLTKE